MESMDINLETKEGKILVALIPVAVIVGTILSILVYKALGSSALLTIIGGAIIASIIIFLFLRTKQS